MGKKVFVTKGDGEHGYHQNSYAQRSTTDGLIFPILDEALHRISLPPSGKPIVVADLGVSSGSNSVVDVLYVVKVLRSRGAKSGKSSEASAEFEFQAYFTDLPHNDFNHLFKSLSEPREAEGSKFYVAGVPGSFCDRLFPQSSVHVFISMFSVHFLSQIPDSVTDENSLAFNRGNLWLHGSTDATAKAYAEQFSLDLKSFLRARSEELAPGGMLCFIIKTRRPEKANVLQATKDSVDVVQICLRETIEEVLSKGILTKEQVHSHNVPLYYPLFQEELLKIIESFSSSFEIHTAKEVGYPLFAPPNPSAGHGTCNDHSVVRTAVKFTRGILGGMFEETMGTEGQETFWQHFSQHAKKHASAFRQDCQFGCIVLFKK